MLDFKMVWQSKEPKQCSICHAPIFTQFIDGRLKGHECWAIMCPPCFQDFGVGLGTGKGQRYKYHHGSGDFVKVAG